MKDLAVNNNKDQRIFKEAYSYDDGGIHGIWSKFDPRTEILPKGFQLDQKFKPLSSDIVFEKDVSVKMRDGITIYTDLYRPKGEENVPVIIAWSPYGKSGGSAPRTTALYNMLGIDNGILSGLAKFEGPDPAYWCSQGYAICNPDPRGVAYSEGDIAMFGTQEGRDCHDLIEWLAEQEWCNGKVGMSGTSYLAISQWFTAAERPPHLAAINPCEGLSDVYRDLTRKGGMADLHFTKRLQVNHVGNGLREDVFEEAQTYPFADHSVWQDKIVNLSNINVPAYVVASYSNTLHTTGTFRAWRKMASEEKWLRIHNTQEWPDYYDEDNTEDLRKFFDYYLKGESNDWQETPRVRYAVHDFNGNDRVNTPATSFPPVDVNNEQFFLDGKSRELKPGNASEHIPVIYDTQAGPGMVSFIHRFEEETVLVGYPKAHLWVSAEDADDMDLFFYLQKLDKYGNHLQQFVIPNQGALMHDLTEDGGSVLRYKGSNGRHKVSARNLSSTSGDQVPEHSFDRTEKLAQGEIVAIEVDLMPIGMVLYPGEQLRFVITGKNFLGAIMPGTPSYEPENAGKHIVHTGGQYKSFLQLPVMH